MIDPLAEIVALLQPCLPYTKSVSAAGTWHIQRSDLNDSFYCAVLSGSFRLEAKGHAPLVLTAGDFVLIPAASEFSSSSITPMTDNIISKPVLQNDGSFRLGKQDGPPDTQYLIGHCEFGSPDADFLVTFLPTLMHIRGQQRFSTLVQLAGNESHADRPGRDLVLAHYMEILFIESLRSTVDISTSPGLLRGLHDVTLLPALKKLHENPSFNWSVAQLAGEASLSRSAFFEHFKRTIGRTPMEYLLNWRMVLAKKLLREKCSIATVAERVGYSSANTFSVAFHRFVGHSPAQFIREQQHAKRVVYTPILSSK